MHQAKRIFSTLLVFLILTLSLHAQLFNKTYKLGHISTFLNNIYKSDSSVYCVGFTQSASPSRILTLAAEISNHGDTVRTNTLLVDSFIQFNANPHTGVSIGSSLSYCGNSNFNDKGFAFDLSLSSLAFNLHTYLADTSLLRFNLVYSAMLSSGSRFYLGAYENQLYI